VARPLADSLFPSAQDQDHAGLGLVTPPYGCQGATTVQACAWQTTAPLRHRPSPRYAREMGNCSQMHFIGSTTLRRNFWSTRRRGRCLTTALSRDIGHKPRRRRRQR